MNNLKIRSEPKNNIDCRNASPKFIMKLPDKPIHSPRDSLFSSTSGHTNYRGFANLGLILLVISNSRLVIENILKYGVLVNPWHWLVGLREWIRFPLDALFVLLNLFALCSLYIEKGIVTNRISEYTALALHSVCLSAALGIPPLIITLWAPSAVGSAVMLALYSILFLKLVSFVQVNFWCRNARLEELENQQRLHDPKTKYPDNLTVSELYYFLLAPTLCYELNFPRSVRVRKWFLVKRCLEFFLLVQLQLALIQQWVLPLIRNAVEPFVQMETGRMLERLLKLSVPNHLIWLIGFYCLFHSFCNITAELLRFSDREFYRDWWNAESIQEFWQKWNVPVHNWCLRHLYKPLMRAGYSKLQGSLAVFIVSAFFHEYLLSIPLRMPRLWAFSGMISQIPLQMICSNLLIGPKRGNIVVWLSLILGQPLCIFMYMHDYYMINLRLNF